MKNIKFSILYLILLPFSYATNPEPLKIAFNEKQNPDINVERNRQNPIFIFDVDNCLYRNTQEVNNFFKKRIAEIATGLNINSEDLFAAYKISLTEHQYPLKYISDNKIFSEDIISKLEEIRFDFTGLITPDLKLKNLINSLEGSKFCFSNSYEHMSKSILQNLGIIDLFQMVFYYDYRLRNFVTKPLNEAFSTVEKVLAINDTDKVFYFDDSRENCILGNTKGWHTFHITSEYTIIDALNDCIRIIRDD